MLERMWRDDYSTAMCDILLKREFHYLLYDISRVLHG